MKALSIKQPWAHAILHFGKDIENRDWATKFRGTIAVHASKKISRDDLLAFALNHKCSNQINDGQVRELIDSFDQKTIVGGAILGTVEIVDCVTKSDSPWFFGDYGFVLRNPIILPEPIFINGALGFWGVPKDVERQILGQI